MLLCCYFEGGREGGREGREGRREGREGGTDGRTHGRTGRDGGREQNDLGSKRTRITACDNATAPQDSEESQARW